MFTGEAFRLLISILIGAGAVTCGSLVQRRRRRHLLAWQALGRSVPFGQPALGEPALGQPGLDQPGLDQPTLDQPGLGQPALGQPTLDQPALGQPALGRPALDQPALGQPALGQPALGRPALGQPGLGLERLKLEGGALDVAAEVADVLAGRAADAADYRVQFEVAVQPGLVVHADQRALRTALSRLVRHATLHAPGGRILLCAARHGGRVQIAVIDDGDGPDPAAQQAALRDVSSIVALQGGTLDIVAHPGEGTTVLLRLPEARASSACPVAVQAQQPPGQETGTSLVADDGARWYRDRLEGTRA